MKRNYSIDTLRSLSAILVVFIHVSAEYVSAGINNHTFDLSFWFANIIDSLSRISVPIFVLISGRFLIKKSENPLQFYKKRAARILIPLITWTFLYLTYRAIVHISHNTFDISELLNSTLQGRPFYHMWYLYMLIGLYLFTPVLNKIIKKASRKQTWFLAISLLFIGFIHSSYHFFQNTEPFFLFWFIDYLGYFILGFLIKDYRKKLSVNLLAITYILSSLSISILSCYTAIHFDKLYFYEYTSPFVIIASLSIYIIFQQINFKDNFLSRVSHLSLGVYLIHAVILEVLISIMHKLNFYFIENSILGIPFLSGLTLIVSFATVYLLYQSSLLRKTI